MTNTSDNYSSYCKFVKGKIEYDIFVAAKEYCAIAATDMQIEQFRLRVKMVFKDAFELCNAFEWDQAKISEYLFYNPKYMNVSYSQFLDYVKAYTDVVFVGTKMEPQKYKKRANAKYYYIFSTLALMSNKDEIVEFIDLLSVVEQGKLRTLLRPYLLGLSNYDGYLDAYVENVGIKLNKILDFYSAQKKKKLEEAKLDSTNESIKKIFDYIEEFIISDMYSPVDFCISKGITPNNWTYYLHEVKAHNLSLYNKYIDKITAAKIAIESSIKERIEIVASIMKENCFDSIDLILVAGYRVLRSPVYASRYLSDEDYKSLRFFVNHNSWAPLSQGIILNERQGTMLFNGELRAVTPEMNVQIVEFLNKYDIPLCCVTYRDALIRLFENRLDIVNNTSYVVKPQTNGEN